MNGREEKKMRFWKKDKQDRCWCGWCRGKAGIHGKEAEDLYRQQIEALQPGTIKGGF